MNATELVNESESRKPHLTMAVALGAKLNLADFQNAVPMLRELSINNDSVADERELDLSIVSVPAFLKTKQWYIDAINPRCQGSCRLSEMESGWPG
ncbi:hypothetical protein HF289_15515 [Acidithiobacillus ferrooxidans]|uniref:hypothetical protein n=1 Tax=Acidithiobacillus ferrooxidans TaxID=920 RepID=UPI001C06547D|nr:hypothetical protein [Acidithiobacillus ferrooxidans]MBU2858199.1 hypothetical protein [Acidithiobacillus ferrooxidans]MBU2861521.1 hypothetical protein [Acidithiobacillus ferrooxidans]MCL4525839.1 hypothetical protein [Gammaproteobacteria bacterium]